MNLYRCIHKGVAMEHKDIEAENTDVAREAAKKHFDAHKDDYIKVVFIRHKGGNNHEETPAIKMKDGRYNFEKGDAVEWEHYDRSGTKGYAGFVVEGDDLINNKTKVRRFDNKKIVSIANKRLQHTERRPAEGDPCPTIRCTSKITLQPTENCNCHIAPPCSNCINNTPYCQKCGYDPETNDK